MNAKCKHCPFVVDDGQLTVARRDNKEADLGELVVEILRLHFLEEHQAEYETLRKRLRDEYGD